MQFTASALAEDDTAQAPFSLQETPFKHDFSERPNLKGPGARLKGQHHSANVGYVCHKLAQMTLQTGDLTLQLEGHFGLYAPSFGLPKPTVAVLNADAVYWPGKFPQRYTTGLHQPDV